MRQYEEIIYASGSAAVGFWTMVSANLHLEATLFATIFVFILTIIKSIGFGALTWFTTKTLNFIWDKKSKDKDETINP